MKTFYSIGTLIIMSMAFIFHEKVDMTFWAVMWFINVYIGLKV
jgi:hypothetical protein